MYIDVIKGQELNVYISESLENPENMMFPVFKQASQALAGIVRQAREFDMYSQRDGDFCRQERLFRYSSNIIAFSGQRGGGKTSTMLSFSKIMQRIGEERKWDYDQELQSAWEELQNVSFIVLSPLEPSVLEGQQSILSVVLSRLYAYGERLMWEANQRGGDAEWLECVQRNLTRDFQNCLSGIRGVKYQRDAAPQDLRDLQDINDGARLRQYFSDLVEHLLQLASHGGQRDQEIYYRGQKEICYRNTTGREAYLVLQLDDADSQIDHSYQVLEDVRKYLVVPKMVILMSADVSIFRQLVLEKYAEEFPALGSKEEERQPLWADLRRMGSKYLDKLIPSIQLVTLPLLDQMVVQQGDNLELRYLKSKPMGEDKSTETGYVFPWSQNAGLGLQDFLLTAIYQKTGIIFVTHTAYANNIIPTTMRGIMHLLYLLSTMENIPSHSRDGKLTPEGLKELVERQLPIAEENLSRFSRYFREDWLNAKVTRLGDLAFLRHLGSSARSVQVQLTIDYLLKRYEGSLPENFDAKSMAKLDKSSQILLEEFMAALHLKHRTQEDFSLSFAIHTVFTLGNHCAIWQQKRKAVQEREKAIRNKKATPDELLVFDYAPERTYLPDTYRVPEVIQSIQTDLGMECFVSEINELIQNEDKKGHDRGPISNEEKERSKLEEFLARCMLRPFWREEKTTRFNFMNFISVLLQLWEVRKAVGTEIPAETDKIGYGHTQQYRIYEMQENALSVAANWDVQDYIFKFIQNRLKDKIKDNVQDNCIFAGKLLGDMYGWIDKELGKINSGMLTKKLNSEKLELFDASKLNGIAASFRYTGIKKAVIGDIDVAQCMLSMLKKNRRNQEANLQWEAEKPKGTTTQADAANPDAQAQQAMAAMEGGEGAPSNSTPT